MSELIGKWKQSQGQAYAGLIFDFKADGTFESEYAEMGITSSGTYAVEGEVLHMDQTSHTFGLLGKFDGRFMIDEDTLKLIFGNPGEPAPEDLEKARLYLKV